MLCEEGMTTTEARSALLVQNTKQAIPPKTQNDTRKIDKYCTNCGMIITMWKHVERRNKP